MSTQIDSLDSICNKMQTVKIKVSPQFIRPRFRRRTNKTIQSRLYNSDELEAMKDTFIGKIINDIHHQK